MASRKVGGDALPAGSWWSRPDDGGTPADASEDDGPSVAEVKEVGGAESSATAAPTVQRRESFNLSVGPVEAAASVGHDITATQDTAWGWDHRL